MQKHIRDFFGFNYKNVEVSKISLILSTNCFYRFFLYKNILTKCAIFTFFCLLGELYQHQDAYSPMPYNELMQRTLEKIESLVKEEGWDAESVPKESGDMVMESRVYKDGLKIFRGHTTITGSPKLISDIVWTASPDVAKRVDKYVTDFRSGIKTFKNDPDTRVDYVLMSFPWPVWKRDMSYAITRKTFSPSKTIIWAASVSDVKLPNVKKTVRMEEIIGAVVIEKIDESKCKVTRLIFGNPSGSLPVIITNTLGSNQVAGLLQWIKEEAQKQQRKTPSKIRSRM